MRHISLVTNALGYPHDARSKSCVKERFVPAGTKLAKLTVTFSIAIEEPNLAHAAEGSEKTVQGISNYSISSPVRVGAWKVYRVDRMTTNLEQLLRNLPSSPASIQKVTIVDRRNTHYSLSSHIHAHLQNITAEEQVKERRN